MCKGFARAAQGQGTGTCKRKGKATDTWAERRERAKKLAGVVQLIHCRGHCIPLWAVFQPLQVVLSFACSVASLSRSPSHYLPCQLQLPEAATADYLFGKGNPSTWCAGLTTVHCTPRSHTPIQGTEKHDLPQIAGKQLHESTGSRGTAKTRRICAPRAESRAHTMLDTLRIPFGDHPLKLERYRED